MIEEDAPLQDLTEKRELFNTLELGLDARQFLDSKLGHHVRKRANDEMYEATQALATADPFDRKTIMKLQAQHAVASAAISWLLQAMHQGTQAEKVLETLEQSD